MAIFICTIFLRIVLSGSLSRHVLTYASINEDLFFFFVKFCYIENRVSLKQDFCKICAFRILRNVGR